MWKHVLALLTIGLSTQPATSREDWFQLNELTVVKIGRDGNLCLIERAEGSRRLNLFRQVPGQTATDILDVWRSGDQYVVGRGDPRYKSFAEYCLPLPVTIKLMVF